jgi:H+/Cl- antiporter ClcA
MVVAGNADTVAWLCFIVGLLALLTGGVLGVVITLKKAPADAKAKLDEAKSKIDDAKGHLDQAQSHLQTTGEGIALAAGAQASDVQASASAAATSADAAKSAIEQVESIIGSLPENLRFAGLLVLIGTVLMSVATIQFGGISLF